MGRTEVDPIVIALRIMQRRADLVGLAFLGLILLLVLPLWLVAPPPLEPFALAGLSLIFAFPLTLLFLSRRGFRRMRASLERVRPKIRDVGIGSVRGLVLVTDDQLFVQSLGTSTFLSMFFTSGGAPRSPSAREALRWTAPFRWTREALYRSPGRTTDSATTELSEIRKGSGAMFATADVTRYSGRNPDPDPPARMATLYLSRLFVAPSFDWILGNTGRITAYLRLLTERSAEGRHP